MLAASRAAPAPSVRERSSRRLERSSCMPDIVAELRARRSVSVQMTIARCAAKRKASGLVDAEVGGARDGRRPNSAE